MRYSSSIFSVSAAILSGTTGSLVAEVHNYRSGISMELSGEEGSDYAVETFFHDPKVYDQEVVYIKGDTSISFSHNELNVCGKDGRKWYYLTVGEDGEDGEASSGDEGLIRYRVDGDLNWGFRWTQHFNSSKEFPELTPPAFERPLKFSNLKYSSPAPAAGMDVLGATGDNGKPLLPKEEYFHYGHVDSFGDEWHTIMTWDDDSMPGNQPGDTEWWASDGKVRTFIVNPKTPCLTFSSGGGKFYTTPAKHYKIPKIFDQTTYLEGDVSVTLTDINGNDVFYRIVSDLDASQSFTDGSSKTVTLGADAFSDGEQFLQYYYAGNQDHTKTRKIVKNPAHPSAGEQHGTMLWGSAAAKQDWVFDVVKTDDRWWKRYQTTDDGGRDEWEELRNTGGRYSTYRALINALLVDQLGTDVASRTPTSYATSAKEMLMQNMQRIDPLGAATIHTQDAHPSRELFYRGYYDDDHVFDLAFGYDTLINVFKSTDDPAGITPVEDYYLRDLLARAVFNSLASVGNIYDRENDVNAGGMWDVARRSAAVACMFAMPSYDTPYYGKSGVDGKTGGYEWAPFKDDRYSWKQVFVDNNMEMKGYPNYSNRLGIEEYNCGEGGIFLDRPVYFGHMGPNMAISSSLIGRNYPDKKFPHLEECLKNALEGNLTGIKGSDSPQRYVTPTAYNKVFGEVAREGVDHLKDEPKDQDESSATAPYHWGFYDEDFDPSVPGGASATPSVPQGLRLMR